MEEKMIKQHIKQQEKMAQAVQQMQSSGNAANTSLQQMILMNMSGLDISTSVVNERVQIELEKYMDELEEQKILHERQRTQELKKIEQETKDLRQSIAKEKKDELQRVKESKGRSNSV